MAELKVDEKVELMAELKVELMDNLKVERTVVTTDDLRAEM